MTKPASPPVSRRKAILGLGFGAVAVGAISAPIFGLVTPKTSPAMQSWWTRQTVNLATAGMTEWSGLVGSSFTVAHERGSTNATLKSVTALESGGDRPDEVSRARAFKLVFAATAGAAPAGDRIYTLRHASSTDMSVYFSPTAKTLLAVFN